MNAPKVIHIDILFQADRKSVKSLTVISFVVELMYPLGPIKVHLRGGNFVYRFIGKARYYTTIFSYNRIQ